MWMPAPLSPKLSLFGPSANRRARTYRPERLSHLEGRTLLAHQSFGAGALVGLASGRTPDYRPKSSASPVPSGHTLIPPGDYSQVIPAPVPGAINSTNPIWKSASCYQYGPDPDQQFWVLLPSAPNGKLDLIIHSGGFMSGSPTSEEIDGLAERDLARGMTVISVGYRKLITSDWPSPVDDISVGIDDGVKVAQSLTGNRISDITETGLSAGGTALALINYSANYPSTATRPNRIITISAPLIADAVQAGHPGGGFSYKSALQWGRNTPKSKIPITLMGTQGDPIALEKDNLSNIKPFASYLRAHGVHVETYLNPHDRGQHGRTAEDFQTYPDVAAALQRAYDYNG
jgi:acetyl esterase/lipase